MKDIEGKVAVITGGGGGVGKAAGALFASKGMKVVLADMNAQVLDEAVSEITDAGGDAIGVVCNVKENEQVQALADKAFDHYGKVHVAMCNAGTLGGGSFFDGDIEPWHHVIDVNLYGTLHSLLAFLPRMIEQDEPCNILATTSGAGAQGTMYSVPSYAASKMAIVSVMESLYGQLRDQGAKVKPGIIFPPLTRSGMGSPIGQEILNASGIPAVLAEPEELAQVILEGILADEFWINVTLEQDERIFGGRMKESLIWEHERVLLKAKAMTEHLPPDDHIYGMR